MRRAHREMRTPRWGLFERAIDRLRRRGFAAALRALRLSGAAVAAYAVAVAVLPQPRPLLAPLTALLIVQVTLYSTVTDSLRRILSVVAGVVVAVAFSDVVGFSIASLGAIIAASIVVGYLLRLGPHLLEVPISAMLVLGVGGAEAAAWQRISETLVGAAVGVAVNLVLPPSVQSRTAGEAVVGCAADMGSLLDAIAEELAAGASAERAHRWLDDARRLGRRFARADETLERTRDSRRLNPRALGAFDAGPTLRSGLDALEHCAVALRALCRSLVDSRRLDDTHANPYGEDIRNAFGVLLHDLARAVRAFGALVLVEAQAGEPRADELAEALDALREARVRLTELLLIDQEGDPELWQQHGSLLSAVDRVLRELDVDERYRQRERQRQAAMNRTPRSLQTAGRLRANARRTATSDAPHGAPNPRPPGP